MQVSRLNSIHHQEGATISSLMTFCCITCLFFFKNQKRSSIENNFLYLLVPIIFSAPPDNLRTNNLIFAIDSLCWAYFFPQRPYQSFSFSEKSTIVRDWNQHIKFNRTCKLIVYHSPNLEIILNDSIKIVCESFFRRFDLFLIIYDLMISHWNKNLHHKNSMR